MSRAFRKHTVRFPNSSHHSKSQCKQPSHPFSTLLSKPKRFPFGSYTGSIGSGSLLFPLFIPPSNRGRRFLSRLPSHRSIDEKGGSTGGADLSGDRNPPSFRSVRDAREAEKEGDSHPRDDRGPRFRSGISRSTDGPRPGSPGRDPPTREFVLFFFSWEDGYGIDTKNERSFFATDDGGACPGSKHTRRASHEGTARIEGKSGFGWSFRSVGIRSWKPVRLRSQPG